MTLSYDNEGQLAAWQSTPTTSLVRERQDDQRRTQQRQPSAT